MSREDDIAELREIVTGPLSQWLTLQLSWFPPLKIALKNRS